MPDALFDLADVPRRPPGRHEVALNSAVELALAEGRLTAADEAVISLARANAWALDESEVTGKPYAVSQLTGPYRELLESLTLTPAPLSGGQNDSLDRALAEFLADGEPSGAEIHHDDPLA